MRKLKLLAIASTLVAISACDTDKSTSGEDALVSVSATSNFSVSNSVVPFPTDLLFKDSLDGTLNIPVADANDLSDPAVAMNALDGFSTVSPITTGFTDAILSSSISGDSVRMYKVSLSTTPGGAVVNVSATLTYGVDYAASVSSVDTSGSTLAILPLKPLDPKSSYYVVITSALKSSNGDPMGSSTEYILTKSKTPLVIGGVSQVRALSDAQATALEPLRQLVSTSESTLLASDPSLSYNDIIMSWSFTTQSVGDVLTQVRTDIRSGAVPATAVADTTVDSPLGAADIWAGSLSIPYFLAEASSVNDATVLDAYWTGAGGSNLTQYNTTPSVTNAALNIPLMLSVPKSTVAAMPAEGYPIVIFQHGITSNRATMMALADAFASAGMAVVAIDMPMHGLTGNETDGTQAFKTSFERTFDLDVMDNSTSAQGPDSIIDASGSHFYNLTNLLNTRDNIRQAVSDLFTLTYAIEGLTAGSTTFDSDKIYFVGHSLGAMVGTTYAALEPQVRDAAFVFGGGSMAKILDGSAAFGPTIAAGLAANGVNKGSADYEQFIGAAQTAIDSADPINYATALAAKSQGIVFFEIAGGNSSPSDLVVPNRVPDGNDSSGTVPAPLAGTEPMLSLMGLTQVNSDQTGTDLKDSIKLVVGNHSSLLSAAADGYSDQTTNTAVRAEIQTIIATFLATDGAYIDVNDAMADTLLQAP